PGSGEAVPGGACPPLPQGHLGLRARGSRRTARPSLAGQRPRARPRRREGGAHELRRHDPTGGSGASPRRRRGSAAGGPLPREGREPAREESHGPVRGQRQPGRARPGSLAQRPLPPAGEARQLGTSGTERIPSMRPLTHDRRVVLIALAAALPALAAAFVLLWTGDYTPRLRWTVTAVALAALLVFANALHERVVRPLQTVSNILAAMREEDFSIRARGGRPGGALAEGLKINSGSGENLLGQPEPRLRSRSAEELGLSAFLDPAAPRMLEAHFPGGSGRWEIRRGDFRQGGKPHRLLALPHTSL